VVNWLAGIPVPGTPNIDYQLKITGNGTITATLVCPDIPPSNSAVRLDGGVDFKPTLGVAIMTDTVDMSMCNGNVSLGTADFPALTYAGGGVQFRAGGTMSAQGSVIVGGDPAVPPDIDIKGTAAFTWNEGFIAKLPEEWQDYFSGGPSTTLPLVWQQLGATG
jgi:hypothetical protein